MAVVTDLGTYDDALVSKLQNLDGLLLEANHDINMLQTGAYPYPLKRRIMGDSGHLSNERSGQLLCELLHDKFGSVILGHLSKENNYEKLAYEAVRLEVTMGDNPYKASDFPMYVAKVCTYLSEGSVNVLDISQTIVSGYFNMMMIVDMANATASFAEISDQLDALGEEIGVTIKCQKEEIFEMMHRI